MPKQLPKPKLSVSIHTDHSGIQKPQNKHIQKIEIETKKLPNEAIRNDSTIKIEIEAVNTTITEVVPEVKESFSQTVMQAPIDTNNIPKSITTKKKVKRSFNLSPSKVVVPVNRDF